MNIELTTKEYRRLLDIVYIGNWVLNSTRGDDRFEDYDNVESLIFSHCAELGMDKLYENCDGVILPSREFEDGGIHEAIADYEDAVFFEILAEEFSYRDMDYAPIDVSNYDEFNRRVDDYMEEFHEHGLDNVEIEKDI